MDKENLVYAELDGAPLAGAAAGPRLQEQGKRHL